MKLASKYEEIMKHPHHVSKTRPQMPMSDRAAQFAPFAALTGYDSERRITMQDGAKIPMDDVLSIDGELFSSLE